MDISTQINTFSRFSRVSRETIRSLIQYEQLLINANKNLNLIGKSTIHNIWIRHFLDSAQLIDFIDKNEKSLVDLGSGAGFPGLVLAIIAKDRKISLKVKLIEKSPKKIKFLTNLIFKLSLDVEILNANIFDLRCKIKQDLIVARAFKPLEKILELMHKKVKNWKKIFIFLGKTGQNELLQASKNWDIKYKKRMSITSNDSFIVEINDFKKK